MSGNGNGNGKVDQRIVECQRRLTKAREPLAALDLQIQTLSQQLEATQTAHAEASAAHDKAGSDYVDSDSAQNRKRLFDTAQDAEAAKAKLKVLTERVAKLQAQRVAFYQAVETASAALANVNVDVRIDALYSEISAHDFHIAAVETTKRERQKLRDIAKAELRQLELQRETGRENLRKLGKAAQRADWLARGNDDPDRNIRTTNAR
jgi:hypothetical protein